MLNTSEQFGVDDIGPEFEPYLNACQEVMRYASATYQYASKQDRIRSWARTEPNIPEIVISCFTTTLLHRSLSYQAICGMLNHKIKLDDTIDRVRTIAEIIAVISKTGLIHIKRQGKGETTTIAAGYELTHDIPTDDRHELNKHKAQEIVSNYDDIQGSMLLGCQLNHHEDNICLAHINRMNRIPLSLSIELLKSMEEMPTFELDTPDKKKQWEYYKKSSLHKYVEVVRDSDNKVFTDHKYCTRGRCYDLGYHISSQGTSYKKAIVQLHKRELVKDTY
jgi:hypothetical protein